MKQIYGYGTMGYFKQQVELAEFKKTLITEAVAARLSASKITADEMSVYVEILRDAEHTVRYAKSSLAEHPEENTGEPRQNENLRI